MIIVMKAGAGKKDRDEVVKRIKELGYKPHIIHGTTRDVIGALVMNGRSWYCSRWRICTALRVWCRSCNRTNWHPAR